MSAVNSDCEKVTATRDQQYFLSTDMTEDLGSIREVVLRQAKGKIGAPGFRVIRHFLSFHRAWAVAAEAVSDRQLGFSNFRRQRVHVNIP